MQTPTDSHNVQSHGVVTVKRPLTVTTVTTDGLFIQAFEKDAMLHRSPEVNSIPRESVFRRGRAVALQVER